MNFIHHPHCVLGVSWRNVLVTWEKLEICNTRHTFKTGRKVCKYNRYLCVYISVQSLLQNIQFCRCDGVCVCVCVCVCVLCVYLQIALFQQFPQLKACVRPAVEKAVQELLMPVVDRSIKIALTTTEHIVKKV